MGPYERDNVESAEGNEGPASRDPNSREEARSNSSESQTPNSSEEAHSKSSETQNPNSHIPNQKADVSSQPPGLGQFGRSMGRAMIPSSFPYPGADTQANNKEDDEPRQSSEGSSETKTAPGSSEYEVSTSTSVPTDEDNSEEGEPTTADPASPHIPSLADPNVLLLKDEPKWDNELIPEYEKKKGSQDESDAETGMAAGEQHPVETADSEAEDVLVESRNGIVPLASPYLIVGSPIHYTNKNKHGVAIPAFMVHFSHPVPAFLSFGRASSSEESGSGVGPGDGKNKYGVASARHYNYCKSYHFNCLLLIIDHAVSKEAFFRNPGNAMPRFRSDFLENSPSGNPLAILSRMKMESANPSAQFPLEIFQSQKSVNEDSNHSGNIFEYLKSIQQRPISYPEIYMSS
jgi:hypothetical protein